MLLQVYILGFMRELLTYLANSEDYHFIYAKTQKGKFRELCIMWCVKFITQKQKKPKNVSP
jgi:TorA maturation chaperone TorD